MNAELQKVIDEVEAEGHTVVYVSKFGSHLYGTSSPESDEDYKGIFLPSKESCLLNTQPDHFTFSSGDREGKNTKDDVDVQFWSMQYWLLNLLRKGETNAIDLLYSFTNEDCIVYKHRCMEELFVNHNKLLNVKESNSYIGYCKAQAAKYGLKATKVGVLKNVIECAKSAIAPESWTLGAFASTGQFKKDCFDEKLCFIKSIPNKNNADEQAYLFLCGKKHQLNINLVEFLSRIEGMYETYGNRAKDAENNEGIDWKAISHALRAVRQMDELLVTGSLNYPLRSAEQIKAIKEGKMPWDRVQVMLETAMDCVDALRILPTLETKHELDRQYTEDYIFWLYKVLD